MFKAEAQGAVRLAAEDVVGEDAVVVDCADALVRATGAMASSNALQVSACEV